MYKTIIFDFFGVIQADPYQRWLNKHGLKRQGPYAEASDLVDMGRITKDEFHTRLSELSGQPAHEVVAAFFDNITADITLVRFIEELHGKYKVGLLSNSRGDYLRPILDHHGITGLFDEIIISSEVGIIKPDTGIFKLALNKMNIEPREAVFIDDRQSNTDAAESIGITSIVYADLATLKEKLAGLGISADR